MQAICLFSNAFSRSVVGFITTEVYLIPTIEKLSIALPAEMAALVRRAVDGGEYSSNSEVIVVDGKSGLLSCGLDSWLLGCNGCGGEDESKEIADTHETLPF